MQKQSFVFFFSKKLELDLGGRVRSSSDYLPRKTVLTGKEKKIFFNILSLYELSEEHTASRETFIQENQLILVRTATL